jgi:fumarylacetoacetase
MIYPVDETHDLSLECWLDSANLPGRDFPIQNLPFGRFRTKATEPWRVGVAIGDKVLDLAKVELGSSLNIGELLTLKTEQRRALRHRLSKGFRKGSVDEGRYCGAIISIDQVELGLPCVVGNYTDFYIGIHHAQTVGNLFRPDQPLLPNYKWVPIGYHGRASSINVSPDAFHRPYGQILQSGKTTPTLLPTRRLDYELELGLVVGRGNQQGRPISINSAEEHLFGITLLNDWSARDIQSWEYQPLGPFLSKNFASTISPWIVTMEALAPFRVPYSRMDAETQLLSYLDSQANREYGSIDIELEVMLQTKGMAQAEYVGDVLGRSNFTDGYWTAAQLVAHHTSNGCNLQSGDLLGSGTLSGAGFEQSGSLIELSQNGRNAVRLSGGDERAFLEDGDEVLLRARCKKDGFRSIGFGHCRGKVLPPLPIEP